MGQMVGGAAQGFGEVNKPFDLNSLMAIGGQLGTTGPVQQSERSSESVTPQLAQQATVPGDNPPFKNLSQQTQQPQQQGSSSQMGAGNLIDKVGQMFGGKPLSGELIGLGNAGGSGNPMEAITSLLSIFGL